MSNVFSVTQVTIAPPDPSATIAMPSTGAGPTVTPVAGQPGSTSSEDSTCCADTPRESSQAMIAPLDPSDTVCGVRPGRLQSGIRTQAAWAGGAKRAEEPGTRTSTAST